MTAQQTTQPATTDPKWLLVLLRSIAVVGLVGLPLLVVWSAVDEHRIAPVVFDSWGKVLLQGFAIALATMLLLLWLSGRFKQLNPLPLVLMLFIGMSSAKFLGSALATQSVPDLRTSYDKAHREAIVRQAEAIPRTGFFAAALAVLLGQRIAQRRKPAAPQPQAV